MRLLRLSANGFRNLNGSIELGRGLNILVGENGQGKTNWLEAAALLSMTRSFRTSRLTEAVSFGESQAIIRGTVEESAEIARDLQLSITGNTKSISVNGAKEPLRSYLSQLAVVVFESGELDIVRGHPEARRRFLDDGIVGLHPPFVQVFSDYSRVLKQKNALLAKAADKGTSLDELTTQLEPWNDQLAALATRIHKARVRFVERLNEAFERDLFGGETVSIRYVSLLEGKGDLNEYANLIAERLKLRVQAELASGHSLIGTHRDELEIFFDGRELRKFGSSGQQRSAVLLLQLANINVFNATRGEYPLFLIDDIDAELDYERIGRLLAFLDGKTQTIVTTSKESFVERFGSNATVFRVNAGDAEIQ